MATGGSGAGGGGVGCRDDCTSYGNGEQLTMSESSLHSNTAEGIRTYSSKRTSSGTPSPLLEHPTRSGLG